MKILILIYGLYCPLALASGDDGLHYEELSDTTKEMNIDISGGNLQCSTWLQTDGSQLANYSLELPNLGAKKESLTIQTASTDCSDIASLSESAKHGRSVKAKANFILFRITPSDEMGNPLPKKAFDACTIQMTLENRISLRAYYWQPKDRSACR